MADVCRRKSGLFLPIAAGSQIIAVNGGVMFALALSASESLCAFFYKMTFLKAVVTPLLFLDHVTTLFYLKSHEHTALIGSVILIPPANPAQPTSTRRMLIVGG